MSEQSKGETARVDAVLPQFDFAMRQMTDTLTAIKEKRQGWESSVSLAQAEYDALDAATLTPEQLQQLDRLARILERANQEKLKSKPLQE